MSNITFNIKFRGCTYKAPIQLHNGIFEASRGDHQGLPSAGIHTVTSIARERAFARFVAPKVFEDKAFLDGYDQRLCQGRISDEDTLGKAKSKFQEFQKAGSPAQAEFLSKHRENCLISDASNYPFNEGHFVIKDGNMLPLPQGEVPVSGKHYVMDTTGGGISFPLIDLENKDSLQDIESAFFLAKIIHEGEPIGLLDRVPGTEKLLISDFRGHIGQIFHDDAYSKMNSPERIVIHSQLIKYLWDSIKYQQELQDILDGKMHDFGEGEDKITKKLPQTRFHHTYWIEGDNAQIYCVKTYPGILNPSEFPGVSFAEAPYFLQAIADAYEFAIKNAFIGTNGRDVRTIIVNNKLRETISETSGGTSLGDYFGRPLPNFVAFECIPGHRHLYR